MPNKIKNSNTVKNKIESDDFRNNSNKKVKLKFMGTLE